MELNRRINDFPDQVNDKDVPFRNASALARMAKATAFIAIPALAVSAWPSRMTKLNLIDSRFPVTKKQGQ